MAIRRHTAWLASTLLAGAVLAGCGGSDGEPLIKPTSDSSPTASATADPDGFTAEQRAVADAVKAYTDAVFTSSDEPVSTTLNGLATQKVVDGLTAAAADEDDDLVYTGIPTLDPQSVEISGDTATYKGCRDGSQIFRVPKGETEVGPGARTVGRTQLTVGLVRQGESWVVDDPRGEQVETC